MVDEDPNVVECDPSGFLSPLDLFTLAGYDVLRLEQLDNI